VRPLADGQSDPRPVLDCRGENLSRLVETAAGPQHVVDFRPVLHPLLDLVIIAMVRQQRLVSLFFVGRMVHASRLCGSLHLPMTNISLPPMRVTLDHHRKP
jgi:hypothetical protein